MKGKIELLIDETGCDRAQAELALEMCGYDVERAIQEIPNLLKDLLAVKVKLRSPGPLYGLLLAVVNLKSRKLLRLRSVVSYHPAVWMAPLEGEWLEFEKYLYACRLWEGSLQNVSQELEREATALFYSPDADALYRELRPGAADAARSRLADLLARVLGGTPELVLKAEVLSLAQYQSMRREPVSPSPRRTVPEGMVLLRVALEGDPAGPLARELRAGDLIFAQIIDPRDIAQYLAKLFGGRSDDGLLPLMVPVESAEPSKEGQGILDVRVRFAVGVSGEVQVPADIRVRINRQPPEKPWWRKWFRA